MFSAVLRTIRQELLSKRTHMGPSILVPVARHLKEQWRLGAGSLGLQIYRAQGSYAIVQNSWVIRALGEETLHLMQMGAEWM